MKHPRGIALGPQLLLRVRGAAPTRGTLGRGLPGSKLLAFFRSPLLGNLNQGVQGNLIFEDQTGTFQDGFRVADSAFDIYELYVGEDAPVDFEASGQPVDTSPTLPFSWTPTPPGVGTKVLHVVVRKRSKYDLVGFNVFESLIEINAASVQQLGPISAPTNVKVYDGITGYIRVVAKYVKIDDANPADEWEVYVKIGSAPVIGVDAVTSNPDMIFYGEEAGLAVTLGPYTPGTVAHVLVVSKRDSDSERASAAIVLHTIAPSLDLAPGVLFGGTQYEQR